MVCVSRYERLIAIVPISWLVANMAMVPGQPHALSNTSDAISTMIVMKRKRHRSPSAAISPETTIAIDLRSPVRPTSGTHANASTSTTITSMPRVDKQMFFAELTAVQRHVRAEVRRSSNKRPRRSPTKANVSVPPPPTTTKLENKTKERKPPQLVGAIAPAVLQIQTVIVQPTPVRATVTTPLAPSSSLTTTVVMSPPRRAPPSGVYSKGFTAASPINLVDSPSSLSLSVEPIGVAATAAAATTTVTQPPSTSSTVVTGRRSRTPPSGGDSSMVVAKVDKSNEDSNANTNTTTTNNNDNSRDSKGDTTSSDTSFRGVTLWLVMGGRGMSHARIDVFRHQLSRRHCHVTDPSLLNLDAARKVASSITHVVVDPTSSPHGPPAVVQRFARALKQSVIVIPDWVTDSLLANKPLPTHRYELPGFGPPRSAPLAIAAPHPQQPSSSITRSSSSVMSATPLLAPPQSSMLSSKVASPLMKPAPSLMLPVPQLSLFPPSALPSAPHNAATIVAASQHGQVQSASTFETVNAQSLHDRRGPLRSVAGMSATTPEVLMVPQEPDWPYMHPPNLESTKSTGNLATSPLPPPNTSASTTSTSTSTTSSAADDTLPASAFKRSSSHGRKNVYGSDDEMSDEEGVPQSYYDVQRAKAQRRAEQRQRWRNGRPTLRPPASAIKDDSKTERKYFNTPPAAYIGNIHDGSVPISPNRSNNRTRPTGTTPKREGDEDTTGIDEGTTDQVQNDSGIAHMVSRSAYDAATFQPRGVAVPKVGRVDRGKQFLACQMLSAAVVNHNVHLTKVFTLLTTT
jgi:hypothetical protein